MAIQDRTRDLTYREKRTGSPKESLAPLAESRAQRYLWVDWLGRETSCAEILGYSEVATDGAGQKYIHRVTPWRHPDWKGWPLYASDVGEIEGEIPRGRSADDVGAFSEARCSVTFTTRKYAILEDDEVIDPAIAPRPTEGNFLRYFEVQEKPAAKYQTLEANQGLVWDSDNQPVSLHAHVILFESQITLIWRQVPPAAYREFGPTSFSLYVGNTNSVPFGNPQSLLGQKPTGTMVQGMPSKEVVRQGNGEFVYDVTIPYLFKPQGANYFFRPNKNPPGFELVRRLGGGLLFPQADLRLPYLL